MWVIIKTRKNNLIIKNDYGGGSVKITIRAARVNKGLTLKEASKALGITLVTLSNYENGKTNPNVEMAQKISQLYGIAQSNLIFLPTNNN